MVTVVLLVFVLAIALGSIALIIEGFAWALPVAALLIVVGASIVRGARRRV
jgi:hypothetical protein